MARIRNRRDLLSPKRFFGTVSGAKHHGRFFAGFESMMGALENPEEMKFSAFASDSMVVWNRCLSFLRDPFFRNIADDPNNDTKDRGTIWRTYLLEYFAQVASGHPGDFLEVGCYQGHTASVLCQRVDFAKLGKRYHLFDLFEWNEGDPHLDLPALLEPGLYERVKARFADKPFVSIHRGPVPDTFPGNLPDQIAFAHIDMNNATAEAAAVEAIYPRLPKGGTIVFDDYGWWMLSDQKQAVDRVLANTQDCVLELPTGQGLLIKRG